MKNIIVIFFILLSLFANTFAENINLVEQSRKEFSKRLEVLENTDVNKSDILDVLSTIFAKDFLKQLLNEKDDIKYKNMITYNIKVLSICYKVQKGERLSSKEQKIFDNLKKFVLQNKQQITNKDDKALALLLIAMHKKTQLLSIIDKLNKKYTENNKNVKKDLEVENLIKNGNLEKFKKAVKNGLDLNYKNFDGDTLLLIASYYGKYDIAKFLIDNHAKVNAQAKDGTSPLLYAVQGGYYDIVKLLLENHADVNIHTTKKEGITPLINATKNGYTDIVKLLLKYNADVDKTDEKGFTPLMLASETGRFEIVKELLKKGAKINQKNDDGISALFLASQNGHYDIAKFLINKGAEVNFHNKKFGDTPLTIATYNGRKEIVKLLLENGADKGAVTNDGLRAINLAMKQGFWDIVDILRSYK